MQCTVSDPPECLSDLTPRVQKSDYQPTKITLIQQMVIVSSFYHYLHLFLKKNNIFPRSRFSLITVNMLGRDFRLIYLLTMKTLDWLRRYNVTGPVWCIANCNADCWELLCLCWSSNRSPNLLPFYILWFYLLANVQTFLVGRYIPAISWYVGDVAQLDHIFDNIPRLFSGAMYSTTIVVMARQI